MPTAPDGRLTFIATARVASLLRGRRDLEFRTDAMSDTEVQGGARVLLAALTDDVQGEPSTDGVRIAVLADEPAVFDDTRFDDYVFPSTSWPEIAFRAACALRRKARVPVCLRPASLEVSGRTVQLSVTEHRLLTRLLDRIGVPVARTDLERAINDRPSEEKGDIGRALDAHVYRLRRKLRVVPDIRIETLRQRGFSLSLVYAPRPEDRATPGDASTRALQ